MGTNSGYWGRGDGAPPETELILHSCGHQVIDRKLPGADRPNGREDYQLIYIHQGYGFFDLDGTQKMEAGAVILYEPGQPQRYRYSDDGTEVYYVHFSGPAATSLLHSAGLSGGAYDAGTGETVCVLFEKIIQELQTKPMLYRQCSVSLFMELTAALSRKIQMVNHHMTGTAYHSVLQATRAMHKDLSQNIPIAQYAAMCNLSQYYFAHCFRSVTGNSPIAYRNRVRIDKAKELLEENLLSISEIAPLLGFESVSYFSKAFKKLEGLSPRAYRRKACGR